MAKVYAIHPLELQPGVSGADLEQFLAGEGAVLLQTGPGKATLVKGDRGARAGQYALLTEYDSVAARDQAYPVADVPPEEQMSSIPEPMRSLAVRFLGMASGIGVPGSYTDYVVVGE